MARELLPGRIIGVMALGAMLLGVAGIGGPRDATRTTAAVSWQDTAHVLNYPIFGSDWPQTFDPADAFDPSAVSMLYDNLVRLDTRNRIVPDLAASWTVSADGRVYTFHLRTDARFSDLKPVTADDVIYSLNRALNPKAFIGQAPSPVAMTYLGHIVGAATYTGKGDVAGLKKIDTHTVQITLDSPIAFFLQTLSYLTGDVVEKGTPVGGLTTANPMRHQISSGPWMIASYTYRSSLTFVPNPGYFAYKQMKLRRVYMPFVADLHTMYQGYESGQYALTRVPEDAMPRARRQPDFHISPLLAIEYLVYNVAKPPFNNRALRLATDYAINRDVINNRLLYGTERTIYSIVPQDLPGYDAAGKSFVPHYDLAKARLYLALARRQMGKSFPASLTLRYAVGDADLARIETELQYEWKLIGLTVKIQPTDRGAMAHLVVKPTTSLAYTGGDPWLLDGWSDDYPDPQDFTTILLAPSSPYNIGNYDNRRFESLISSALTARGEARAALYVAASRLALNDAAWAMLGQPAIAYRWRPTIRGLALWSSHAYPGPLNGDWTNVDVQ